MHDRAMKALFRLREESNCETTPNQALSNQPLNNLPVNIRQPEVPPCVTEGELLMVETQQMQQRSMQVMNVDTVHLRSEPEFIGSPVDRSALRPATCEPDGESV